MKIPMNIRLFLATVILLIPVLGHTAIISFDGFTPGATFGMGTVLSEAGFDFTQAGGGISGSPRFVDVGGGNIGIEDSIDDVYGQWIGFSRDDGGDFIFDSVTGLNRIIGLTPVEGIWVNGYLGGALVAQDKFFPTTNTPTLFAASNLLGLVLDEVKIAHSYYVPFNEDVVLTAVQLTQIPEPVSWLIFTVGLLGLARSKEKRL
ncbi:hypothetical protein [endosymbiont of Lamellibrachia barhami]|uniref:hypothetical protein n=1 Tax=endosymbiont of Lamellibrachia barhami TaxID=205975 RepID=UPI0015A76C88|nr:hypothetical protein [endosymbiont of Lamellibrachia barhami]